METIINAVFWFFVFWFVSFFLRALVNINVVINEDQPKSLERYVLPLKLEYTKDQWFAWDHQDEFMGQAPTKEQLIDYIAKQTNFPKEKFEIISEGPMEMSSK